MSEVRTPYDDAIELNEVVGLRTPHLNGMRVGYLRALADTRAQREAADALAEAAQGRIEDCVFCGGTGQCWAGPSDAARLVDCDKCRPLRDTLAAYRKACEVQS